MVFVAIFKLLKSKNEVKACLKTLSIIAMIIFFVSMCVLTILILLVNSCDIYNDNKNSMIYKIYKRISLASAVVFPIGYQFVYILFGMKIINVFKTSLFEISCKTKIVIWSFPVLFCSFGISARIFSRDMFYIEFLRSLSVSMMTLVYISSTIFLLMLCTKKFSQLALLMSQLQSNHDRYPTAKNGNQKETKTKTKTIQKTTTTNKIDSNYHFQSNQIRVPNKAQILSGQSTENDSDQSDASNLNHNKHKDQEQHQEKDQEIQKESEKDKEKEKEKEMEMSVVVQLNPRQKHLVLVMTRTTILVCLILMSQIIAFLANVGVVLSLEESNTSRIQIIYSIIFFIILIDDVINIICLICQYEFSRKLYQLLFGKIDEKIKIKCASRVKNRIQH